MLPGSVSRIYRESSKETLGVRSWGNSQVMGGLCVSALQGVKRGEMYPLSISSLSSILVSLFNGSNRFVIGIMSAASHLIDIA